MQGRAEPLFAHLRVSGVGVVESHSNIVLAPKLITRGEGIREIGGIERIKGVVVINHPIFVCGQMTNTRRGVLRCALFWYVVVRWRVLWLKRRAFLFRFS